MNRRVTLTWLICRVLAVICEQKKYNQGSLIGYLYRKTPKTLNWNGPAESNSSPSDVSVNAQTG